jgi:hypothetical protein
MHGGSVPHFGGHIGSEHIRQRLLAVNVQIVHDEVNRVGCQVGQRQGHGNLSEFTRTIRGGEREMATRFRLYSAEDIGGAAAFVFVIATRLPPRLSRRRGTKSARSVTGFSSGQTTGSCGS